MGSSIKYLISLISENKQGNNWHIDTSLFVVPGLIILADICHIKINTGFCEIILKHISLYFYFLNIVYSTS